MIQDKAQPAVNGYSLNKGCNAVLGYLWASLRARRAAVLWGVAPLLPRPPFPPSRPSHPTATSAGAHPPAARRPDPHT